MHTSGTGFAVILDKFSESGPSVVLENKSCCLVLTWVSSKNVIMLVLEYMESKVIGIRDVDMIMMLEEVIGVDGPVWLRIVLVSTVDGIGGKSA